MGLDDTWVPQSVLGSSDAKLPLPDPCGWLMNCKIRKKTKNKTLPFVVTQGPGHLRFYSLEPPTGLFISPLTLLTLQQYLLVLKEAAKMQCGPKECSGLMEMACVLIGVGVMQVHTFVRTCHTAHLRSEQLLYGNCISIKLVNLKKLQPAQVDQAERAALAPLSSSVGELALRSVPKASMSQDCTRKQGTEQPLCLWDYNPFNPEPGLDA